MQTKTEQQSTRRCECGFTYGKNDGAQLLLGENVGHLLQKKGSKGGGIRTETERKNLRRAGREKRIKVRQCIKAKKKSP